MAFRSSSPRPVADSMNVRMLVSSWAAWAVLSGRVDDRAGLVMEMER